MAKKVQVDFVANATQFLTVANQVTGKMGHIANIAGTLKGQLVSALGGLTIGAIVQHMAEFAKSIEDASKRLALTVEETYRLKIAASEAGVEFNTMFKVRSKAEQFLQDVVNRKPIATKLANQFGITGQERWNEALNKMLQGGATRNELARMVGPQAANWMANPENRKNILEGRSIDAQAVHAMAQFQMELENLTDTIKEDVLPILADFVGWIRETIGYKSQYEKAAKELGAEAQAERYNKGLPEVNDLKRYAAEFAFENAITGIVTGTPEEKKKFYDEALQKYLSRLSTPEIASDIMARYQKERPLTPSERAEKRRQQFEEEQKAIAAEQPVRTPTQPELSTQFSTNQFLKIGGLMGTDTTYRLERLGMDQLRTLQEIRDLLAGKEIPEIDNEPINLGVAS